MPVIKNGQYADILLRKEHTGYHEDVLLENKYYRISGLYSFVVWSGVWWEIQLASGKNIYQYVTTGRVGGDGPKDYQKENRRLPLLWRKGVKELRIAGPNTLTYDFDAGRIHTLTLDTNGNVTTGTVEQVSGEVAARAKRWLKDQKKKTSGL